MPIAKKRRRSEIVDTINDALEIVDDVGQDEDGELVRAVVASCALKQISEGNYEDDREESDEYRTADEDEEEPVDEAEEEPEGEGDEDFDDEDGEGEPEDDAEEEPDE